MDVDKIFNDDGLFLFDVFREANRRGISEEELIRQFVEEGLERAINERYAGTYREPQRVQPQMSAARSSLADYIFGPIERGIEKFKHMQGMG
jgi:hypothetical protein